MDIKKENRILKSFTQEDVKEIAKQIVPLIKIGPLLAGALGFGAAKLMGGDDYSKEGIEDQKDDEMTKSVPLTKFGPLMAAGLGAMAAGALKGDEYTKDTTEDDEIEKSIPLTKLGPLAIAGLAAAALPVAAGVGIGALGSQALKGDEYTKEEIEKDQRDAEKGKITKQGPAFLAGLAAKKVSDKK